MSDDSNTIPKGVARAFLMAVLSPAPEMPMAPSDFMNFRRSIPCLLGLIRAEIGLLSWVNTHQIESMETLFR